MRRLLLLLAFTCFPALAQTADLDMVASGPDEPISIGRGEKLNFFFSVANVGSADAKNVTVTFNLPPGLQVERLYAGETTCDYSTLPLRCTLPDLGVGSFRYYFELTAAAPQGVVERLTLSATAATTSPEANTANNTASRTYLIGETIELNVQSFPATARVSHGGTFTSAFDITNYGVTARGLEMRFDVANGTFERIEPPPMWTCQTTATSAVCTAPALDENCRCSGRFEVVTRAHDRLTGGDVVITARASSPGQPEWYVENNVARFIAQVYREITVTTTADSGAGSLRAALLEANANCSPGPCRISFAIPMDVPSLHWLMITPQTPLPVVTADRLFLDGSSQTAFAGDRNPDGPEIAIDGRFTADGPGLDLRTACEVVVQGLAIGNFREPGIMVTRGRPCTRFVAADEARLSNNYLGVDPSGRHAWPNLRGVQIDRTALAIDHNVIGGNERSGIWIAEGFLRVHSNRIGTGPDGVLPMPNGASGVYLGPHVSFGEIVGNTISYHPQMGVAVAASAVQVDIRGNSMRHNGGLGIDWQLDGITPPRVDDSRGIPNAPVLFSAVYDAARGKTTISGRSDSGPEVGYVPGVQLDFYANDGADADGEQWLESIRPQIRGTFTVEVDGDFRGRWINATTTRTEWFGLGNPTTPRAQAIAGGASMTSEFSNAVPVQ